MGSTPFGPRACSFHVPCVTSLMMGRRSKPLHSHTSMYTNKGLKNAHRFCNEVQTGDIVINHHQFPNFLYDDSDFDKDRQFRGLFQGDVLGKVRIL